MDRVTLRHAVALAIVEWYPKNGRSGDMAAATAPPEEEHRRGHATNPGKANTPTRAPLSQI